MTTKLVYDCTTGEMTEVDLTPEEIAVAEETARAGAQQQANATFETSQDAERLALVGERAQTDPAFAALAELSLGGRQL